MEILLLLIFFALLFNILRRKNPASSNSDEISHSVKFHYKRKSFLMTKPENDFFDVLCRVVTDEYYVFPQIHLSSILDHKDNSHGHQNWEYAFRYISQKSVDFIVCDKEYRRTMLAVELDDSTHNSEKRRQRDANVEHMLKEAGVPLLRINRADNLNEEEIAARIRQMLPASINTSDNTAVATP
jgi:very-short-patch-repair endonuclease